MDGVGGIVAYTALRWTFAVEEAPPGSVAKAACHSSSAVGHGEHARAHARFAEEVAVEEYSTAEEVVSDWEVLEVAWS